MAMLAGSGYLTQDEQKGVKAVLSAAALTYVASFVSALLLVPYALWVAFAGYLNFMIYRLN